MKAKPKTKSPSSLPTPRVSSALRRHLKSAGLDEWQIPAQSEPQALARCMFPNIQSEPQASARSALTDGTLLTTPSTCSTYSIEKYPGGEREVRRVLGLVVRCRHGELGSHLWKCNTCNRDRVTLNSCRNRHCPTCGGPARRQWKQKVASWELNCPYWHIVFTLPHELNEPMVRSGKPLYRLLMRTAKWTLLKVAERGSQCQPGMIMTLHTWGQRMNHHVHVHIMLSGGGLNTDTITELRRRHRKSKSTSNRSGTIAEVRECGNGVEAVSEIERSSTDDNSAVDAKWIPLERGSAVLDTYHIAEVFKQAFLRRLKRLMKRGLLDWPEPQRMTLKDKALTDNNSTDKDLASDRLPSPLALQGRRAGDEGSQPANPWLSAVRELWPEEEKLLSVLESKPWIADCQPAPPEYVGCDALINYLASYISGTAISNRRMLVAEDDRVEFVIKDYKHKRISSERLTGTEFVQRFALHILPARMQRMRYAGLFQAEGLKNRLEVCRAALGEYQLNHPDSQHSNQPKQPPSPDQWREDEDEQVEASEFSNGMKCQCGQLMESAERIEPMVTMKMIDFVRETVSQTLPMLLGEVIGRLLAELKQTRSRHRVSRRMRLYDSEVDVLCVLLSEALPAKEDEMESHPADPTHQHLSGIPPPRKRFTHDDSTVTEYA